MMPSNHLILCRPLLLLPSNFPSIRVFSNESALCIRCQRIGVSSLASVLPMNTQDWSPLGWTGWISLQSKGLSRVLSNTTVQKQQFFGAQTYLWSNSRICALTTGKTIALTRWTFVGKVMSVTCWEHILGLRGVKEACRAGGRKKDGFSWGTAWSPLQGTKPRSPHGTMVLASKTVSPWLVPAGVDGEEPVSCGWCLLSEQGPCQEPGIIQQLRRCSISAHQDGALGKHTLPS